MAKFILFVTLSTTLVVHHFAVMDNPRLEGLGEGDFFIYSREVVQSPLVMEKTNVGFGIIYRTRSEHVGQLRAKFSVIDGESITLDNFKSTRDILGVLGHSIINQHSGGGVCVLYAYSGRFRDFIVSSGHRINLQIGVRGDRVSIGWPVILGSF